MRFTEIINIITESSQQTDALLTTLNYLHKTAKKEGSNGEFKMSSIINQVKNAGAESFEYDNFVDAFESSPSIQNLVDNYNEEYVTLKVKPLTKSGGGEEKAADVTQLAQKAVSL